MLISSLHMQKAPCLIPFTMALKSYKPPAIFEEIVSRVRIGGARIFVFGTPGIGKSALSSALAFQFAEVRCSAKHHLWRSL